MYTKLTSTNCIILNIYCIFEKVISTIVSIHIRILCTNANLRLLNCSKMPFGKHRKKQSSSCFLKVQRPWNCTVFFVPAGTQRSGASWPCLIGRFLRVYCTVIKPILGPSTRSDCRKKRSDGDNATRRGTMRSGNAVRRTVPLRGSHLVALFCGMPLTARCETHNVLTLLRAARFPISVRLPELSRNAGMCAVCGTLWFTIAGDTAFFSLRHFCLPSKQLRLDWWCFTWVNSFELMW